MGQSNIILKKSIDDYLDIPKRQEEKNNLWCTIPMFNWR